MRQVRICKSQRIELSPRRNCYLLPVTRHPHPSAGPLYPVALDPDSGRSWTYNPASRHPHIACSRPAPVTPCPYIARTWRHCLGLNPNRRRSLGHENFACDRDRSRRRRSNLLGGRRCCHCRWRCLRAAEKRQWDQRQHVKANPHIRLLFMDSFCTSPSALSNLAIRTSSLPDPCMQSIAENGF
jgi:hypothetical protein